MTENLHARVNFIYVFANDLPKMRHFYTDLLGMDECGYFEDDKFGWLCYQMEGFQMMWFRPETEMQIPAKWAAQTGYPEGTEDVGSWSVKIPQANFKEVILKLKEENVPIFKEEPELRQESYMGFTVKDPMGNTVELYYPLPRESKK